MNSTKLKNKINRTDVYKVLHYEAIRMYKNSYESDMCIDVFMHGVNCAIDKLKKEKD